MVITNHIIDAMVAHARECFPNEACGLIAADNEVAVRVYHIESADPSPVTYRMDPKQQLQAMTEIDDRGWDMAAIYHSHTHTRAYPSPTDVRLAFYSGALYVIVSLADFEAPDVRAFQIENGEIVEVSLVAA